MNKIAYLEGYLMTKESSKLSGRARSHIKKDNFAFPSKAKNAEAKKKSGNYPIHDKKHARAALALGKRFLSEEKYEALKRRVHAKYPEMGKKAGEGNRVWDTVLDAFKLKKLRNASGHSAQVKWVENTLGALPKEIADDVRVMKRVQKLKEPNRYQLEHYLYDAAGNPLKTHSQVVSRDVLDPITRKGLRELAEGRDSVMYEPVSIAGMRSLKTRQAALARELRNRGLMESGVVYGLPLAATGAGTALIG